MTSPSGDPGVLAAALIQIASHTEHLAALDQREHDNHADLAERVGGLTDEVRAASERIAAIHAALDRVDEATTSLEAISAQVSELAGRMTASAPGETGDDGEPERYQPAPPPRWWKLAGPEREAALDRLRAWVEQVYCPSYGQLAVMLPPCWEHHPLCLHTLDWLSELWSLLYLSPSRESHTLAAQAEWQTRLLPAAAEQMAYEAANCSHHLRTYRQGD